MRRDLIAFPEDENGDALWAMSKRGDDLMAPRELNFSVIFPTEDAALKFAVHLLKHRHKVSFSTCQADSNLPWQVEVHPFLVPTHENVTRFEDSLAVDASGLGGRNDGWD